MEINSGGLDEKVPQSELDAKGFEKCLCNELVEKLRVSESKCTELKLEIEKIKRDNEILDTKVRVLEEEKSAIEDELKVLKMENGSKPSYGGEEEDEILQLGIEIKILECEKQMAEKEVEIWKQKYKELELKLDQQNQALGKEAQEELATPYNDTPDKRYGSIKEDKSGDPEERNCAKRVNRKLLFKEDGEPFSNDCAVEGTEVGAIKSREIGNLGDDEEVDDCEEDVQVVSTLKRKRAANVVTSDTESDIDDNVPISQSLGIRPLSANPNRIGLKVKGCLPVSSDDVDDLRDTNSRSSRRLVKLSQEKGRKKKSMKMTSEDVQDDDGSAEEPDDESDGMNDFIVDDELEDDVDCDDENVTDSESEYQDDSDSEDSSPAWPEWEYEADMLAALGKDPILCMKGVCAIYRRDICEGNDQGIIPSYPPDGQGFNLFDLPRGSRLAEFLTEGDPKGDVKKSVEELNKYDPAGEDICYKLAARYSRQLFEIYKNKEDPYFPHS